jgi:hypothetical protein
MFAFIKTRDLLARHFALSLLSGWVVIVGVAWTAAH